MDEPPPPGPLYQSFLDFFALEPPNPWPPVSAGDYVAWLGRWAAYAETVCGLVVPLPLRQPAYEE